MSSTNSELEILEKNKKSIAGGVVSVNRATNPVKVFKKAKGAYLWDVNGVQYIDYHAAFSPYLMGHNFQPVEDAVIAAIREGQSLMGAGTTIWEGELAELVKACVPNIEKLQITNTGSEATYFALRLARAHTNRDEIIVMQGGYNGWHNDVCFNLMDPLESMAGYREGDEHQLRPFSAGMPSFQKDVVHVVEYNDIAAVKKLLAGKKIAAIILEPILQNIGIVKPVDNYLQKLRAACDETGTVLIFDEVKTGFRHALGGYQSLVGVKPDLSTFGKACANGYPLGIIGGKEELMSYFYNPDPKKRVLIAGTYNGHPVPVAAAIATLKFLKSNEKEVYQKLEALGALMQSKLEGLFANTKYVTKTARQGSAFATYFMDHLPKNWMDIAKNHNFEVDAKYRQELIEEKIFHFPTPTKQGSISFAHTEADILETIKRTEKAISRIKG